MPWKVSQKDFGRNWSHGESMSAMWTLVSWGCGMIQLLTPCDVEHLFLTVEWLLLMPPLRQPLKKSPPNMIHPSNKPISILWIKPRRLISTRLLNLGNRTLLLSLMFLLRQSPIRILLCGIFLAMGRIFWGSEFKSSSYSHLCRLVPLCGSSLNDFLQDTIGAKLRALPTPEGLKKYR